MILAVALVAMLVSAAQALTPDVYPHDGGKKFDKWPCEYIKQDLCEFPVKLKIPYFVSIPKCDDLKITLNQVECSKDSDWPCFEGCTTFDIKGNFDYILYASISQELIDGDFDVLFTEVDGVDIDDDDEIELEACEHEVEICVTLKKADLHDNGGVTAGDTETVAYVQLEIKPAADCNTL